jgi:asparagine synthase (glutamine-hydrolysing)
MRPDTYRQFNAVRIEELSTRPIRRDKFLVWESRLRRSAFAEHTLAQLAADVGARAFHPLHDRRFVAALARDLGARGRGDRTSVMRRIFAKDLPDEVIARSSKANFAVAYFRSFSRDFARRWDGIGVDTDLVDPELLRKAWLEWIVDTRSALALQTAWLSSYQRGLENHVADVVERRGVAQPLQAPHGKLG